MKKWTLVTGLVLWATAPAAEPPPLSDLRHTYSIIAHDPATGEFGGGVQSHWFNVGMGVLWAEAGVGAVATQSFLDPRYGAEGLAMMRLGKTADEVLAELVARDQDRAYRQVAMIDVTGNVANFTGDKAIAEHCRIAGANYSVQANLMWKPGVCKAMSAAFEAARGDLAERIMAALDAAQDAGGDIRGMQSAALLVVDGEKGAPDYAAQKFNLRVEDSDEPLRELRRLLGVARAYRVMDQGDGHLAAGDPTGALEAYRTAMNMAPGNHEMMFWTAVLLARAGNMEQARPLFAKSFALWPLWRKLVPRLPASDLLPDDDELIGEIVGIE
jgi:uncharacterized Ntn-hydrolase superfamily protein